MRHVRRTQETLSRRLLLGGAGEVDFVIQTGDGPTPIQVTVEGAGERHLRALDDFYEAFPHATEAVIVTMEDFPDIFSKLDAAD